MMKILKYLYVVLFSMSFFSHSFSQKPSPWIHPHKIDLIAEYAYAKFLYFNINSSWAYDVYKNVFKNLRIEESPELKALFASKCPLSPQKKDLNLFNSLFAKYAFHKKRTIEKVSLELLSHQTEHNLDEKTLDYLATTYCELQKNTYIAVLWPCVNHDIDKICNILNHQGTIIYHKTIDLTETGILNAIRITYNDKPFLGNYENEFQGAKKIIKKRFSHNNKILTNKKSLYTITIILFECSSLQNVRSCKEKIRKIYNPSSSPFFKDTIHINDYHYEAQSLVYALLNKNSLNHLNYAHSIEFPHFLNMLKGYKQFLKNKKLLPEHFCIDTGGVLAAYGLRMCDDLDIIHQNYDFLIKSLENHNYIHSHNKAHARYHSALKDELVFNPSFYFYHKGLKFISLSEVAATKKRRNLKKDLLDLELIAAHNQQNLE